MRKRARVIIFLLIFGICATLPVAAAWSKEPALPDYLENANAQVTNAAIVAGNYPELADDILIARNTIRNALNEYEKNLGAFTGKLDKQAEPTVRQLAETARLQAALVTAKANTIEIGRAHV